MSYFKSSTRIKHTNKVKYISNNNEFVNLRNILITLNKNQR